MEMGLLAAIILALDIYAIWCVLQEGGSGGRKVLWVIAILVFPVVGMLCYFLFGRRKGLV